MGPDVSAYRILGLRPGAEPAAVEAAYRALIKRFHPDREGGDSKRAAEINWAYDQIRKARHLPSVRRTSYPATVPKARRRGGAGPLLGLLLLLALLGVAAQKHETDVPAAWVRNLLNSPPTFRPAALPRSEAGEFASVPIDSDAVDRSVLSALRIARDGDSERLAGQSRRCHMELRDHPDLSRFDQCVAFDEAAVVLTETFALRDPGQFGTAAVTGRQLGAGRLFSTDFMTIESRLERIRTQVELMLAPPEPALPPPVEMDPPPPLEPLAQLDR